MRCENLRAQPRNLGEPQSMVQKPFDGHLICRVEHGPSGSAEPSHLETERQGGKPLGVRGEHFERRGPGPIHAASRSRRTLGEEQGVLNRQTHVRWGKLGDHRTVFVFHQRMNDRLGVNNDRQFLGGQAEQPASLDHLKSLVHHRGRIDRDLRPHPPVGVIERFFDGNPFHLFAGMMPKRAAAGGEDQPSDILAASALKRLEDRAVFAVDGNQFGSGPPCQVDDQRSGDNERLLVRDTDPLARLDRGPRPAQARRPDNGGHHSIHFFVRSGPGDGFRPKLDVRFRGKRTGGNPIPYRRIGKDRPAGPKPLAGRGQRLPVAAGDQGVGGQSVRVSGDHIEATRSDRSGCPQKRHPPHVRSVSPCRAGHPPATVQNIPAIRIPAESDSTRDEV